MTHICGNNSTIIGSDNCIHLIGAKPLSEPMLKYCQFEHFWSKCSEIIVEIHKSSFKKMYLKVSPVKWRQFCRGLNMLTSVTTWVLARLYFALEGSEIVNPWYWKWELIYQNSHTIVWPKHTLPIKLAAKINLLKQPHYHVAVRIAL